MPLPVRMTVDVTEGEADSLRRVARALSQLPGSSVVDVWLAGHQLSRAHVASAAAVIASMKGAPTRS